MPSTYRIYSVSERDVITGAFDHEFACDKDAVDQARCYLVAYPVVEIWDVDRLVERLEREPLEPLAPDGGMPADDARSTPPCAKIDGCDDCSRLQEADRRIADQLFLIMADVRSRALGLTALAAAPTREDARLMLDDVNVQIGAIARLHRRRTGAGRGAAPDLSQALHDMCTAFRLDFAGAAEIVEDLQPGCIVEPHQLAPLVHVAEAVVHAVKHAHPDAAPGVIQVRCRKDDIGTVWIEVIDDGSGLPEGFDPMSEGGSGFQLVRELGRQLGALFAFESTDRGLTFRLELPAA